MQQSTESVTAEHQVQNQPEEALSPHVSMAQTEKVPQIKTFRDLNCWGEKHDHSSGTRVFMCAYACYIDDDDVAYYGETPIRQCDATLQDLTSCLKRIPDCELFPKTPANTTIFPSIPQTPENGRKFYVKQTASSWNEIWKDTDFIPQLLLGEIEAFEVLKENPHPNIVRYYGCKVSRRDRVVGIVMDRYEKTLMQYLDDNSNKPSLHGFDKDACFQGIDSAVRHLHSLGLAHNDLNPYNIMVDMQNGNRPVLIDFGSCKPFGMRLMEMGTTGWVEDLEKHGWSNKEHDEFALKKLIVWMGEKMAA